MNGLLFSRILFAVAVVIAFSSWASFKPLPTPVAVRTRPAAGKAIAGLEVAFGMEPTTDPAAPLAGELPRRILAVFNGAEVIFDEEEQAANPNAAPRHISAENALGHRFAELPLDHLGLAVDYHDVSLGALPGPEQMAKYRGVLAWLGEGRLRALDAYLGWLVEQTRSGRRVLLIGDVAALTDSTGVHPSPKQIEALIDALGGTYLGAAFGESTLLRVARADPIIGYEHPIPDRFDVHDAYRAKPGSTVYLTLQAIDDRDPPAERAGERRRSGKTGAPADTRESDVIWTSPTGGFIAGSLGTMEDKVEDRFVTRWLIDPFIFFERAFGVAGWPRADFTTLNGRRVFYAHIDGDGMDSISEIDSKTRCGAMIRDSILTKFDLPFTASVIVGLTATPPEGRGTELDVEVARSIFALDNVEVGSHGLAHPMDWRGVTNTELSVPDLPDYVRGGESEVARSVEYIDRELAPKDKPCTIMLWTGSCNPSEEAIEWAYKKNLRNLNGGDPRMDSHFPSYAHLVPPVHEVGHVFQYYTSAANDYIHTKGWTPPYYRFGNVIQTFERSGAPRRVVPINVYFHYYSARNEAALLALKHVMEWVEKQSIAPVFASEYVDIARDFQWARIGRTGPDRFEIAKGPHLRTIRFDDPKIRIDLSGSSGVLGFFHDPKLLATYVHLDGSPRATVQLTREEKEEPRLETASHWVDRLLFATDRIEIETRGIGVRTFVLAGLPKDTRWAIESATLDGATLATSAAGSTADGRLSIAIRDGWVQPVRVTARRVAQ